jgi:hypothetical protein
MEKFSRVSGRGAAWGWERAACGPGGTRHGVGGGGGGCFPPGTNGIGSGHEGLACFFLACRPRKCPGRAYTRVISFDGGPSPSPHALQYMSPTYTCSPELTRARAVPACCLSPPSLTLLSPPPPLPLPRPPLTALERALCRPPGLRKGCSVPGQKSQKPRLAHGLVRHQDPDGGGS